MFLYEMTSVNVR